MTYDVWRLAPYGPVLDTGAMTQERYAESYAKAEHNRNGGAYFVRPSERREAPCEMRGRAVVTP